MSSSISQAVRELAEPKLAEFTAKLIPTVDPARILGVRMPALRKLAKKLLFSPGSRSLIVPTAPIRPVYQRWRFAWQLRKLSNRAAFQTN
ncbi:hypothetical protein [Rothia dentocariosa]|uniref:hypothetical protein n=1 Tax=Rothia dentocariosa TaxID=2047 RepID=UPI00242B9847|nr:hypothetical protein [Rothia dentocariosa]